MGVTVQTVHTWSGRIALVLGTIIVSAIVGDWVHGQMAERKAGPTLPVVCDNDCTGKAAPKPMPVRLSDGSSFALPLGCQPADVREALEGVVPYLEAWADPKYTDLANRSPSTRLREQADWLDKKEAAVKKARQVVACLKDVPR